MKGYRVKNNNNNNECRKEEEQWRVKDYGVIKNNIREKEQNWKRNG